ncbi:MAG: hypothetical protein OCD03_02895 [Hyphomicrobiales bacterium]
MSALGDAVAKLIAAGTRITAQINVFSQILSADKNTDVDDGAGGSLPSMRKLQDEIAPQLLEAEQVAVTAKNTAVAAKDTASEASVIAVAAKDEAVQSAVGAAASELVAAAAELYVRGVAVVNGFVNDLPMNGKKIVNLADGVADGDGVNVGQLNAINDNAETKLAIDQNFGDVADKHAARENLAVGKPRIEMTLEAGLTYAGNDFLLWDTQNVQEGISYNPSTGFFTFDKAGWYRYHLTLFKPNDVQVLRFYVVLNASVITWAAIIGHLYGGSNTINLNLTESRSFYVNQGDTFVVHKDQGVAYSSPTDQFGSLGIVYEG